MREIHIALLIAFICASEVISTSTTNENDGSTTEISQTETTNDTTSDSAATTTEAIDTTKEPAETTTEATDTTTTITTQPSTSSTTPPTTTPSTSTFNSTSVADEVMTTVMAIDTTTEQDATTTESTDTTTITTQPSTSSTTPPTTTPSTTTTFDTTSVADEVMTTVMAIDTTTVQAANTTEAIDTTTTITTQPSTTTTSPTTTTFDTTSAVDEVMTTILANNTTTEQAVTTTEAIDTTTMLEITDVSTAEVISTSTTPANGETSTEILQTETANDITSNSASTTTDAIDTSTTITTQTSTTTTSSTTTFDTTSDVDEVMTTALANDTTTEEAVISSDALVTTTIETTDVNDESNPASIQEVNGLQIDYSPYSFYGNLTIFNISLTSGSNHTTLAVINNQTTIVCDEDSNALVYEWSYNFNLTGDINITIIVSNDISQMSKSFIIYKYYPINGISTTNISSVYNTSEAVTMNLFTELNVMIPQGFINFTVDWSNGNYSMGILDLNEQPLEQQIQLLHPYSIQGNYTVVLILQSQLEALNLSYNVYIWDRLSVLLNSSVKAKVNEEIEFMFSNPPNSNFRYLVTYGDGSSMQNVESDLYRPFDISTLNKSFSTPGLFDVSMQAWNPFYSSSNAYTVNVTAYTPVRLFGGAVHFEGSVEVFYAGKWWSICDTDWDITEANIVCFMAGYARTAATPYLGTHFGVGATIRMSINCGGEEWDIEDCSPQINVPTCPLAGVHCSTNGVFMLKLSDGQDSTVSLLTGQDTVINFDYVADIASFEAILDNSIALDTQGVQNNIQNKTYQFSLSPTMISGYGIHQILFRLTSEMSVKEVKVEVNFEENISQFQVEYDKFVEYRKPTNFNATVASGSNLHFTWVFGSTVINCNFTGNGTQFFSFNHTITEYGNVNVTVVASNSIATATQSFNVIVFNRINGIIINTSKPSYETLEEVDINLMVTDDALQPQGQVNATIDFGNGNITHCLLSVNDTYLIPNLNFFHHYETQGNYSIPLILKSYGDTLYEMHNIQVWDKLNVNLSSVTEGKVDVGIQFTFGSTPRSNFLYHISYGDGTYIQNNETDLYRNYDFESWNKSYNEPGLYNVSMRAWNPVHDSYFSYLIKITQDQILNYTIDKENSQIIPYFYGDSKEILLYFETRNNTVQEVEFELMIGDALINSSSIIINQSEAKVKTIHLPLHRLLQDIPFGNHSMNMTLFAQNRTEVNGLIVQLYYEEKITGLQVFFEKNVEVEKNVVFDATLESGSNFEVKWIYKNNSAEFMYLNNNTRYFSHNFTLFDTGDIEASVTVTNLVSNQTYSFLFHGYYRINGIFLKVGEFYETTDIFEVAVIVNSTAEQPQGNVNLNLDMGDNEVIDTNLTTGDGTLNSGYNTSKQYPIQGNYTIIANLTSPLGSEVFSSTVYVWDKLTVNVSSEVEKKVFENITFEFQNTPNSNFLYILSYGDGDIRQNNYSDLFRPYDFRSWNKSYNYPNDYNVSLYAWNPVYSSFHSYMIHVTQDQITNFTFDGNQSMPILLVSKSVVDVHFNFSTLNNTIVPDLLFNATIGNLSIDTRTAKIDQQAGLLVFSMDSSLMGNLIYELYTIKFSMLAQNETEEHSLDMTIIYEQAIEDIMVDYDLYTEVGFPLAFNVSIINGSNMETDWFLGPTDTLHFLHPCNSTRSLLFNHTFNETGDINVTVVGKNRVSALSKSVIAYHYYQINGFVLQSNTTVQTIENATIVLRVENSANQPQGMVYIEIDFGDGDSTNISLDANDDELAVGVPFSHHYVYQGVYNITAILKSHINSKNLTTDIGIWDKLDVKLAPVSPTRVNHEAEFSFISTPNSNFMYNVSYDDGTFVTNKESDLYHHYNFTSWNKSYSQPKKYYNVSVKAWNPVHSSINWIDVLIEHPLHEGKIGMSPNIEMIPRPDGKQNITMSLLENLPDPSNVVCTFDNDEDDLVINYSISRFGYNHPVKRNYTFQRDGDKNVTFTCYNSVSSYQGFSVIQVRSFTADDFNYTFLNPVNMNMSLVPTIPSDGIHFPFKPKHDPVNVIFNLTLFECSRLPPNIETVWVFGDGTSENRFIQTEFEYIHEFKMRGNYTMTFTILDHNYNTSSIRVHNITLGTMILFCDKHSVDLRKETFTLTATKMLGNATYEFQVDVLENNQNIYNLQVIEDSYEPLHAYSTTNVSLQFYEYGFYLPKVKGFNGSVTEIVYLDNPIIADYNITGEIDLVADASNWRVVSPPGEVKFFVEIINKTEDPRFGIPKRPFTHCSLLTGDLVDRFQYKQTFNITADTPMQYNNTYISLGNLTVSITCSNNISDVTITKPIYVGNDCYSKVGLFERKYSMPNESLPVSTATDVYIYSRINVHCLEHDIKYNWTIRKTNLVGADLEVVNYTNPLGTNTGTFLVTNGSFAAGYYKIELNVTLSSTYFHEYTYMTFKDPLPFSYISGGSTRTVSSNTQSYEFDATFSHDGKGERGNIRFTWTCKKINQAFPFGNNEIDMKARSNQGGSCSTGNSQSNGRYEITGLNPGERFEATVTVQRISGVNHQPTDSFTQLIVVDSGSIPVLSLRCTKNCLSKVAVASPHALRGVCSNCESSGLKKLRSKWKLWVEKETSADVFVEVANFTNMTGITGTLKESVIIDGGQLENGKKYLIAMEGAFNDSSYSPNFVYTTFKTNFPPYNGHCTVNTTTDTINRLSVNCFDWLDEGLHENRDAVRDRSNAVVFQYLYETKITRNTSFGVQTMTNYLYRGGESTIKEVPVQAGDNFTDYNVTILVKIFDEQGDFSLFETTTQIIPPTKPAQINVNSVGGFFDNVMASYSQAVAGGNNMAAVGVLGAAASLFDNVTNTTTVPTEDEVLSSKRVADEDTMNPTINPVEALYIQKIKEIMGFFKSDITLDCTENAKKFSISDIQHVFSTLESLVLLTQYIPIDILEDLTTFIFNMTHCFEGVVNFVTDELDDGVTFIPIQYSDIIRDICEVALRVLNTVMDKMLPAKLQNLDVDLNLEDIEAELALKTEFENKMNAHKGLSNVTNYRGKANQVLLVRQHVRGIQQSQVNLTAKILHRQQEVIAILQEITLRSLSLGEKSLISTTVLDIVTQRVTPDDVDETYVKNFESNKTELLIKIIVYKRNPYNYVENASSLTTGVSSIDMGPDAIVDSVIKNPPVPEPTVYEPKLQTTYPEPMIYFKFEVENDGDAGVVFFKPDNFDISSTPNDTLYSFYFSSVYFPTSQDFEVVVSAANWSTADDGFKIFLDGGVCNKGICYMGIKLGVVDVTSSQSDTTGNSRRRRRRDTGQEAANDTAAAFAPAASNFSMAITTTGCRSYDKATDTWTSDNCEVLRISTKENTVCRCSGTTFSSTFVVPLNTIDFANVWGKFDPANAAVYGTLIAFLVVYVIAALYLRRQDKKDEEKWATHFLSDTDGGDTNFYLLTVQTGMRKGAGTLSNVNFILSGDESDTGIRTLSDGVRKGFATASVNKYIMGTSEPLGNLTHLRIWHDNSGPKGSQSWYLNRVVVDDLHTQERYIFLCDKWLSVEEEDGMIDRILPVSSNDDITSFNNLFSDHAQSNISEQHLWLSMFIRPQRSIFSRVQRLSCILCMLFLTMITNAMFFRSSSEDKVDGVWQVGVIRISVTTIIVSIIGISITTPPIMFITFAFRKCRPPPPKIIKPKKEKPIATISRSDNEVYSSEIENDDAGSGTKDDGIENASEDDDSNNKMTAKNLENLLNNNHLPLPHWVRRIAWFVVFMSVLSSAFFLLLYSMEWGIEKSEEWLSSFMLSFFESLLCVDPLKVLLISVVFALIFKRMADESVPPKVDFEKLQTISKSQFKANSREGFNALVNNIVTSQKPLSEEQVAIMRKKRQEERTAKAAMITLLVYAIYVSAIYSISYMERDQRGYTFKQSLDDYMYSSFSKVSDIDSFFGWLKGSLLPTYFPQKNYANQTIFFARDLQYFSDNVSIRIGPPRLRQVRMGTGDCEYSSLTWPYPCYDRYSITDEDDQSYCVGWTPYNESCANSNDKTINAWKFTSALDIWGIPKAGEYNTYSGGGYIISLKETISEAMDIANDLLTEQWIDRQTRAVFLEFTLYNPNVNLFAYVMFLTEFTEFGRVLIWYESEAFRPVSSAEAVGTYVIACYSIFIAYVIYSFVKFIRGIRNLGCPDYLKHPWHYVDMIMAFLGFAAIGVYIVRIQAASKAMDLYYDQLVTGSQFINFANVVIWDNTFSIIFAILVFVSIIQFLRILGYSKKVTEILSVITNVGRDLYGFLIMFSIMFFTFVGTGYLLFGSSVKEYKSFFSVIGSLTNTFIGVNSLDALVESNPVVARMFYFMYILLVIMTLFTIFAAILNKSITDVKEESAGAAEIVGVMDIVLKSAKSALAFVPSVGKNNAADKKNENWSNLQDELRKGNVNAINVMRLVRETFSDIEGVEVQPQPEKTENKSATGVEEFLLNVDRGNSELGSDSPSQISLREELDDDEKKVRFKFI